MELPVVVTMTFPVREHAVKVFTKLFDLLPDIDKNKVNGVASGFIFLLLNGFSVDPGPRSQWGSNTLQKRY